MRNKTCNTRFGRLALTTMLALCAVVVEHGPISAKVPPDTAPRVRVTTTHGAFTIALLPTEAPETVKNFLGLATGQKVFVDHATKKRAKRPFYDGLTFHRTVPGALIQGGCPAGDGSGRPGYVFGDEINARALGLDKLRVLDSGGIPHRALQVADEDDFYRKVVDPLLRKMGVFSPEDFRAKEREIDLRIREMTLKEAYENMGYSYTEAHPTRPITRGVVAMANSGPATNGSQFFVATRALPMLDGKHTPFGRITRGMDVVDRIANLGSKGAGKDREPVRILSVTRVAMRPLPAR